MEINLLKEEKYMFHITGVYFVSIYMGFTVQKSFQQKNGVFFCIFVFLMVLFTDQSIEKYYFK